MPDPTRRALLATLAASPAALLGGRAAPAQEAAATGAGLISPNVCLLSTEVTEGPYYVDPGLVRADITEGRDGVPLEMVVQVVDAACQPLAGARVDIWHCDAQGNYSGFAAQGSDATADTSAETFLRGTQLADARGVVTFRTVYPGWYRGRTTHIHHKVFLDETNVLTGQIFFPDALSQFLFDTVAAYSREGVRDTVNGNDGIAAQAGEGAYAAVREAADRYVATLVIGVDPAAVSDGGGPGGPGGDGAPVEPPPGPPPEGGGPGAPSGAGESSGSVGDPALLVPGQG